MLKSRNSFRKIATAIFATTLMMILGALALFTMEVHAAEFSYVDENGETKTHEATPLTGTETGTLNSGWYVVNQDILYNNTLKFSGDVHLILADGYTLYIGSSNEPISGCGIETTETTETTGSIYIYGQDDSSGCLFINSADKGVSAYGGIYIYGTRVTVNSREEYGLYSANGDINILGGGSNIGGQKKGVYCPKGNITLGWTRKNDFILVSSYMGKIEIAEGQALQDEEGETEYYGLVDAAKLNELAQNLSWLVPCPHKHKFKYSASGATITAKCNNPNETTCNLTNKKVELTIERPAIKAFEDGKDPWATLTGLDDFNEAVFEDKKNYITEDNIKYYKATKNGDNYNKTGDALLAGCPVVPGDYVAEITAAGKTASVGYTISPGSATLISYSGTFTYDGKEKTVTGYMTSGDMTFSGVSAKGSGTEAGVYPVKFSGVTVGETMDDDERYVVTGITEGQVKIDQASGLTVSLADASYTYDGKPKSITNKPKTNAPTGKTTYTYSFDKDGKYVSDLSSLTKQDVGSYTIYVKATNPNYSNTATTTATLTISKASNPLSVTPTAAVKVGGNKVDLSANVSKAEGTVTYAITGALDGCIINANTGVLTSGAKTGTCTVTVTAAGNKNYNSGNATIAVNITKNDPTPTPDPNKTDISGATVELSAKSFTYKNKAQKPVVRSVKLGKKTLTADKDYTVSYSNKSSKNVGTYKVTVSGIGKYTGSVSAIYKIKQASNPMKVSLKKNTLNVKLKKLKNKDQTISRSTYLTVSKAQGDVTYTKTSGDKKITVNSKNGKIKISKKLKKGTYSIKVSVKAEGNDNYKASTTQKVKFKIVVK